MRIEYPTIIVPNFFHNPDEVVKYAQSLKYNSPKPTENWPGYRSEFLHKLNKPFFNLTIKKILSFYYGKFNPLLRYTCDMQFHKFDKNSKDIKYETQIHSDEQAVMAGVIYLNKNKNCEETGTSVYDENLKRTVKISNNYNTLIMYDARVKHGVTGFDKDERLSIVFFFKKLSGDLTPMERMTHVEKKILMEAKE